MASQSLGSPHGALAAGARSVVTATADHAGRRWALPSPLLVHNSGPTPSDEESPPCAATSRLPRAARLERITTPRREALGIADEHLEPYGHYKAKLSLDYIDSLHDRPDGKLILVTAISPRRPARARPPPPSAWATR